MYVLSSYRYSFKLAFQFLFNCFLAQKSSFQSRDVRISQICGKLDPCLANRFFARGYYLGMYWSCLSTCVLHFFSLSNEGLFFINHGLNCIHLFRQSQYILHFLDILSLTITPHCFLLLPLCCTIF